jgi:chromosomal replication initiation ATPase DnaA
MPTPIESAIANLNVALNQFSAALQLTMKSDPSSEARTLRSFSEGGQPLPKPFPKITHPDRTPIDMIKNTVARHYGIATADLMTSRKCAGIVWPRMTAMWIMKKLNPDWSYLFISGIFGRKDHGSCNYACRAVRARRETEPKFRAETDALLAQLSPAGAPAPSRASDGAPAPSRASSSPA